MLSPTKLQIEQATISLNATALPVKVITSGPPIKAQQNYPVSLHLLLFKVTSRSHCAFPTDV